MSSESLFEKCSGCGKQIPVSISICPVCGKKFIRLDAKQMAAVAVLCLIWVVISFVPNSINPTKPSKAEDLGERVLKDVRLDYSWSKSGFGSIMEADLVVSNNSSYDIKDLVIRCDHFAKSGTKIDSNERTIYERVRKYSLERYNKFNMGFVHEQANSTDCRVAKISVLP